MNSENIKTVKFGGSSLASGEQFRKVRDIITADPVRRYVVPSAPGKRFKDDAKVTDLLYACYEKASRGESIAPIFDRIRERYDSIISDLGLDMTLDSDYAEIESALIHKIGRDYAASRGEYLNGKILAHYLGYDFIDAADVIFFREDGDFDSEKTNEILSAVLKRHTHAVIPGFYGSMPNDTIKTFSRGGSDITGSIVARASSSAIYENWTDVSGFLMADPRIVNDPKAISTITYRELRELSYMGANVLHSESIFPVKRAGIPIRIRNTFRPEDRGTLISSKVSPARGRTVTGIAGKKDFTVISLEKSMMNGEVGFVEKVLGVLSRRGISFEHLPSGIDTMSLVLENGFLKNGVLEKVVEELKTAVSPDHISVHEDIALVATVGHGMTKNVGVAARLFTALSEAGINVMMIDQGSSELNIIVGVENADCANCIRAIYREFFN